MPQHCSMAKYTDLLLLTFKQPPGKARNKMFGFKQGIAKIRAEGYRHILGVTPVKEDT